MECVAGPFRVRAAATLNSFSRGMGVIVLDLVLSFLKESSPVKLSDYSIIIRGGRVDLILSQHAREQIAKRKITIFILETILQHPEQILEEDGLKVYQRTFVANNNKNYLVKAYVNYLVEPNQLVTVYFTGKIIKYRRANNGS